MNQTPSLISKIKKELNSLTNKEKIATYQNFFKTRKGEYGYGEKFLGISVPIQRKVAHQYLDLDLRDIKEFLQSNIHEYKFTALEILVAKYQKTDQKEKIVKFYLDNSRLISNWDLVDTSASQIFGDWLTNQKKESRNILYELARSKNLWQKRIAIVATYAFIKKDDLNDTFKISEILLNDNHDLIHKACGWMLRESGKKDLGKLRQFLNKNAPKMPRTMLRYAIEKMNDKERKKYLKISHK